MLINLLSCLLYTSPVSKNTVTGVFWVMANTRVRMVSGMTASREAVADVYKRQPSRPSRAHPGR